MFKNWFYFFWQLRCKPRSTIKNDIFKEVSWAQKTTRIRLNQGHNKENKSQEMQPKSNQILEI
jgi:hypothetical protein